MLDIIMQTHTMHAILSSTYICTADIVAQKNIVYINQF